MLQIGLQELELKFFPSFFWGHITEVLTRCTYCRDSSPLLNVHLRGIRNRPFVTTTLLFSATVRGAHNKVKRAIFALARWQHRFLNRMLSPVDCSLAEVVAPQQGLVGPRKRGHSPAGQ